MANTIWKEVFLIMCSSSKENARNTERFSFTLRITDNYTLQTLCGAPHNICNDEGKYNGMRPCRAIYGEDREMMDIIFGPFFICDCSTPYFGSLNKEQLERYKKQFQNPEHFFRVGGEIKAVPYKPEKDHER